MQHQEIEKLEAITGLSADEAKRTFGRVPERRSQDHRRQSYINEIMDEAKLTAKQGSQTHRHTIHTARSNGNGYRK